MRRKGFTLVELMVSMALIVFIMSILSAAFVEGLETFRHLKAIGDLQENLRTAVVPLRDDLMAYHFGDSRKLSDDPDKGQGNGQGLGQGLGLVDRPKEGFFRIESPPAQLEGTDGNGLPSYSATNHALYFTTRTSGQRRSDFHTVVVPTQGTGPGQLPPPQDPSPLWMQDGVPDDYEAPGTLSSRWTEVAWFPRPQIDPATGQQMTAGSTLLWTLHRRQRLLLQDTSKINDPGPVAMAPNPKRIQSPYLGLFPEVSCKPDLSNPTVLYFNGPKDVTGWGTEPIARRSMADPAGNLVRQAVGEGPEGPARRGDDLVLSDVVSFEVKALFDDSFQFEDVAAAQQKRNLPADGVYDTATTPKNMYRVRALQITIRIWDYKTEQTRQVTVIQDM